jgi:hypothetical protein
LLDVGRFSGRFGDGGRWLGRRRRGAGCVLSSGHDRAQQRQGQQRARDSPRQMGV